MEKQFNASLPSVSLPVGQQEVYTSSGSDFPEAGELEKLLSQVFQSIRQAGNGESRSFQQKAPTATFDTITAEHARQAEKPMRQWQDVATPSFVESMFANRSLAPTAQTGPAQCLLEASTKSPLPEQTVLFEVCTINQPLNAALRDRHSTGTYYFLK